MASKKITRGLFAMMIVLAILTLLIAVTAFGLNAMVIYSKGLSDAGDNLYKILQDSLSFKECVLVKDGPNVNLNNGLSLSFYVEILVGVALSLITSIYCLKRKSYSGLLLAVLFLFVTFISMFILAAAVATINLPGDFKLVEGKFKDLVIPLIDKGGKLLPINIVFISLIGGFSLLTTAFACLYARKNIIVYHSENVEEKILAEEAKAEEAETRREMKKMDKERRAEEKKIAKENKKNGLEEINAIASNEIATSGDATKEDKPVSKNKSKKSKKNDEFSQYNLKDDRVIIESPKSPKRVTAYHVSFRKDLNKWQVKLALGDKAIKTFNTQLEAINAAKEFARNQNGSIRVHGRDGKIRTIR